MNDSTGKRKIILVVSAVLVSILAGRALRRGFFSSAPSRSGLLPLSMTDENGDKWVLDLAKGQSLSGIEDSDTEPGPPLLVKTDVQMSGRKASIGLVIEGQAGEKYAGGAKKNGRWQPPPRFKIVNEAGKTLTNGVFKYG